MGIQYYWYFQYSEIGIGYWYFQYFDKFSYSKVLGIEYIKLLLPIPNTLVFCFLMKILRFCGFPSFIPPKFKFCAF